MAVVPTRTSSDINSAADINTLQEQITEIRSPFITGWINTADWENRHFGTIEVDYDNLSGTYTVGETVVGTTSGATGTIISDSGSTLILKEVTQGGIFSNNEVIQGADSGAMADCNEPSGDNKDQDTNITHNLGAALPGLLVRLFISETGSDTDALEVPMLIKWTQTGANTRGLTYYNVDTNSFKIQTGVNGLSYLNDNGDAPNLTTDDWYYKVYVYKIAA